MISDYVYQQTGIKLDQAQLNDLEVYFNTLVEWNGKFNLTTITDKNEAYIKHFADSMLGNFAVPKNAKLCDIGSGGGCPAIPLKILRPDIDLTMLDSVGKKVNFLNFVCQTLGLNARAVSTRIEEFSERDFDVVTARAVAPLATLLEYSAPLLKIGGVAVFYKTPNEDVASSQNAQRLLGTSLFDKKSFILPNGDERVIYVFKKNAPTDKKYPRGGNKPRISPL